MKLYDSTVWPVIAYGAPVLGNKSHSCIISDQARAMRFFLGMGRYTQNNAIYSELSWQPLYEKLRISVSQFWHRLMKIDSSRPSFKLSQYGDTKNQ
jgi:hypothetical protein